MLSLCPNLTYALTFYPKSRKVLRQGNIKDGETSGRAATKINHKKGSPESGDVSNSSLLVLLNVDVLRKFRCSSDM